MLRDTPAPLLHPFDTGDLEWPASPARILLLNAGPDVRLPAEIAARCTMVQGFRPDYLALQRAGHTVAPQAESGVYALVLIRASRHRGENEAQLALAIRCLSPDGVVVMAGGKTDGISSLRKRMAPVAAGNLSKNHGEVFWLNNTPETETLAEPMREKNAPGLHVEDRFWTAPGMFSHDHVDAGSRLLAQHIPANLKGVAADFCAGWGYLSVFLAEHAPGIERIELFEAGFDALAAARRNMETLAPHLTTAFHWTDLATEKVERGFDVIVMNPPFHQGRAADPAIGLAMIRAASGALKSGGQLFMVANRGLPYEPVLKSSFARVEELADTAGFKVWKARR